MYLTQQFFFLLKKGSLKLYWPIQKKCFTIFALSSGQGKCGVAVIRISGKEAKESILKMTKPNKLPSPRLATLRYILHPLTGEHLDRGMVIWFPQPKSFTGEDTVELHTHGGSAVINAILTALGCLHNYSPAQPGDFTKRAFYNNKLDLTSVEGLGDLISAETEAQRKQALRQMEGYLGTYYSKWRSLILKCRANIEAYIDFSEDENIEQDVLLDVESSLQVLITDMKMHLSDSRRGERLKSGLNLVILGRPNVGKSTFLNLIVQRPAAIVSPIAGTTRDIVEVSLDIGGYPINVCDTAGLRNTEDYVEKEGVRRALIKVSEADIALIIVEATEVLSAAIEPNFHFEKFIFNYYCDVGIFQNIGAVNDKNQYEWHSNLKYAVIMNKVDLIQSKKDVELLHNLDDNENVFIASLKTGEGFDDVFNLINTMCASLCSSEVVVETPYLTSIRHRRHIESCLNHLLTIINSTENCQNLDAGLLYQENTLLLAAQQLQLAANQLGHVTGQMTTEDILDVIFSSFCIGK